MKLSDAEISSLLFAETADASIPTPAAGKVRLFVDDDGLFKWKDEAGAVTDLGGGGASDLDDLSDVDVSSTPPTDGQALVYDTGDSLWKPAAVAAPGAGTSELVYRYTVAGVDKASIDTGVDTADAGSLDWTNGDLLEVFLYVRTDEAVVRSSFSVTVNNDTGANYDRVYSDINNVTAFAGNTLAQTSWLMLCPGSTATAAKFGAYELRLPRYAGTVGHKQAICQGGTGEQVAANTDMLAVQFGWRNTAAITRLAVAPSVALKKLTVGSELLIYKRLAS